MTTHFILQSIPTIQIECVLAGLVAHTSILVGEGRSSLVPGQPQLPGETPSQTNRPLYGDPFALLESQCLFLVGNVPGDDRNALLGEKEVLKIGVQQHVS